MFDFVRFRKRLHKNKPDRHPTDPATRKNVTFLKNGLMGRSVQSMHYAVDPSASDESSRRPNHVPSLLDALWFSIGPWVALEHGTKVVGHSGCISRASTRSRPICHKSSQLTVLPIRLLSTWPIGGQDGNCSPARTSVLFRTIPHTLDLNGDAEPESVRSPPT